MNKVLLVVLLFAFLQVGAQENAQWRGMNRDGFYPEKDLLTQWPENGPELLWHFDELEAGHGSAAVTSSMVYVTGVEGENGFVVALSHKGEKLWKTFYGKEWIDSYEGVRTTPAIVEGKLYIMSGFGLISCMNAKNGEIIWQVDILNRFDGVNLKWGVTENLLVFDDKLICTPGGKEANVIALNKDNGELIWKCAGKGEISAYCSPALIEHNSRKIVVTHTKESILGIDAINGKLLWAHPQPNKWSVHANTPLYRNGKLYCISGYGKGSVMLKLSDDGTSINELWRDEELDNKLGGVVEIDGKIYGSGDFNRRWYCLDWETGKIDYESKELKKGNIITADGLLYWYTQGGKVALVEALKDSFNIISQFKVPYGEKQHWAHLVIHDKSLYVRHGSSLMVYDIGKKKTFSEWRGIGRTGVYSAEKNLMDSWPEEGPELLWYNDSIPSGYASVAVENGMIYSTGIRGENDLVFAFDLKGNLLWEKAYGRKWDSSYDHSRSTPTVIDSKLYVSSGYGDLACLNAQTGSIIWQNKASESYGGSYGKWGISESILVVGDKVIYTPGGNKTTIIALNKEDGSLLWETTSLEDNPSYTSPLLVNRNGKDIICTVTENYFVGVDAANGDFIWKFNFGDYAGGNWKSNIQTNTPIYKDGEFFISSGYDHNSVKLKLENNDSELSVQWVDSLLDVHHGGIVLIDGYLYGANWENNKSGDWTCIDWETGEKKFSTEWINKGSIISSDDKLYCYAERKGMIGMAPVDPEKFEIVSSFKVPYGTGPHWAHPVIKDGKMYIRHGKALMVYDIANKS